ncbi:Speckle-type POZ protein-like protein [Beauveria bassiana D1-5]|uniref:Speckle-type POZ protein-like protein n=1 Tax=Beauveria bassiana D1-5 TaxID=1245745 RepID=A0A0A2VKG3_BEABA|nr:Speckle-type POZ protein-like protein [Beauveria bassiana D1-5]
MADSTRGPNLGHLLKSGQFSDLTLVCRDQEFNVHKAVVCAQSQVLAAAIREPFQASKTGKIVIEEYDTDTVEQLVEFLYTGDYRPQPHQAEEKRDDTEPEENLVQQMLVTSIADSSDRQAEDASQDPAPDEDLVQHVLVNSIADYYGIRALADLSKEKLRHAAQIVKNKSLLLDAETVALSRTGDTTVHAVLADATAKNIRQHLESNELAALVGEFAIEIVKRGVAVEDELRLDVQRLKDKLAAAEWESIAVKAARKDVEERWNGYWKTSTNAGERLKGRETVAMRGVEWTFPATSNSMVNPMSPRFDFAVLDVCADISD